MRGAFVIDGVLYAGWADGTMTRSDVRRDAPSAHPQPIELAGGFRDLDRVRAIFFDRVLHRIYYTLDGSNRLYYRYFQPETRTVGSWRYEAPTTHLRELEARQRCVRRRQQAVRHRHRVGQLAAPQVAGEHRVSDRLRCRPARALHRRPQLRNASARRTALTTRGSSHPG